MTISQATRRLALAFLTLTQGCSLALDWQPEHLLCNGTACDAGFSCLPEAAAAGSAHGCVRDESLALAANCALDQQCQGNNLCMGGACRAPCETPYQRGVCAGAHVCDQPAGASAAACVPSDACAPGGTCWDAQAGLGVCVAFSDSERRCLPRCSVRDAAPCPEGSVCATLGMSGQQELVCVPAAARAVQ